MNLSKISDTFGCPLRKQQKGFFYLEVLLTLFLISIALVPAMNALQTGIGSGSIHRLLVMQQYDRLSKMEQLQSEPFIDLLSAAAAAGDKNTPSSYSDPLGTVNRRLVYLALYDADADPFNLIDPNTDGDNNLYTGSTADLVWLRVKTEGTHQSFDTLLSR